MREVVLESAFFGAVDGWTEYLCVEVLPSGWIEVTSCSREVLCMDPPEGRDVVWPEGYDPENDEHAGTLPISVDGKVVAERDGDFLVGETLYPHSDDAVIRVERGDVETALEWARGYGWAEQPGFEEAWRKVEEAIRRP